MKSLKVGVDSGLASRTGDGLSKSLRVGPTADMHPL